MSGASFLAGSLLGFGRRFEALAFERQNPPHACSPRIALIIDDIGFSPSLTRKFLALGVPITFSILPCLNKSRALALEVHEHGHEVMLHQPMEPYNTDMDPGPGALYRGFTVDRIDRIIEQNMDSVPFAIGVNNHMGSKFTECQREVSDVLKFLNQVGLFFVDSLTSSHSTAYKTAKKIHMPTACRDRFLDNICDEAAIYSQLHKLSECAFKYGRAIGIGHPHPETASAIRRFVSDSEKAGVSLVHISQVLACGNSVGVPQGHKVSVFGDYT